jgi:hypothetical protein
MTVNILVVEKKGSIKEVELKTYNENELFKKAGFKTAEGFQFQTEWGADINGKNYSVSVYAKTNGRAGQENKYDFPPPVDNVLFFGACVLVNKSKGVATSISKEEWNVVYAHLFGGFEDIGDEDSDYSVDDEEDEKLPRTKEGYVKDDFIVDDDDTSDEDYVTEESSEEEKISKKTKKAAAKKPKAKKEKKTSKTVFENILKENECDTTYLDCTSELCEEEYV